MSGSEQETTVPLGNCPEHGYVWGNDLEYRFPNPSRCHCGREVEATTFAEEREVRNRVAE